MSALDDLARKLGLLQTPSRDAALEWASRCRELTEDGTALEQAAIVAAKNIFATEFRPIQYKHADPTIETLLDEVEQFVSQEKKTGRIMPTWRAEFFANKEDNLPSRYPTIEASDENEAMNQAALSSAAARCGSMCIGRLLRNRSDARMQWRLFLGRVRVQRQPQRGLVS